MMALIRKVDITPETCMNCLFKYKIYSYESLADYLNMKNIPTTANTIATAINIFASLSKTTKPSPFSLC